MDNKVPNAVSGSHTFTQIVAGFYHTCGLRTDNTALCWGEWYRAAAATHRQPALPLKLPVARPCPAIHARKATDCTWWRGLAGWPAGLIVQVTI